MCLKNFYLFIFSETRVWAWFYRLSSVKPGDYKFADAGDVGFTHIYIGGTTMDAEDNDYDIIDKTWFIFCVFGGPKEGGKNNKNLKYFVWLQWCF